MGAIGILQGLLLFGFGLIWKRLEAMDAKHLDIETKILHHIEDTHAHGNGMPRAEAEARINNLCEQVKQLILEKREDHREIRDRLDVITQMLATNCNNKNNP